jgi:UDP-2,4-diacetamido-2,4,6-trideoxy-beta-L-altropyranose hydrolase
LKKRIIFRADGNMIIGFGHVYRLLALADMLKNDFHCVFACNRPGETVRKRIVDTCELLELDIDYNYVVPDLISLQTQMPFDLAGIVSENDTVVLDGYQFKHKYQEALHKCGCKQVVIDDLIENYPFADIIINHAPGISAGEYRSTAKLCLGLDYALLRKNFFSPFPSGINNNRNVYVSMGGSDRLGITKKIVTALLLQKDLNMVHVLCSNGFEQTQLQELKLLERQGKLLLHFNLDAGQIVDIMAECSTAFVSASTVLMEAYTRGLKCFTGYTAQNQHRFYNGFVSEGMVKGCGDLAVLSPEELANMISEENWLSLKTLQKPLQPFTEYKKIFHDLVYGDA